MTGSTVLVRETHCGDDTHSGDRTLTDHERHRIDFACVQIEDRQVVKKSFSQPVRWLDHAKNRAKIGEMPGEKQKGGGKIDRTLLIGTEIALETSSKAQFSPNPHGTRRITVMTGLLLIGLGLLLATFAIATALRPEMPVETFWG